MARLSVSLAQMPITFGEPRRNFTMMERFAAEAGKRRSHLLVLPELWATGYALEQAKEFSSEINKGLFAQISKVATQNNLAVVGSLLEKRGIEVANSAPFFIPNGRMLGVYRKTHLFPGFEEDKYLQPGASALSMELPWGVTGLAICYDLRFPELFRRYALDDAGVVIIPAEWPLERIKHWRALLVARAIENQCYVIACNAAGETGETIFGGHSMIIDPWGKTIIEGSDEPLLITAEIEMDRIADVRKQIPVFDDRRPETYESINLGY